MISIVKRALSTVFARWALNWNFSFYYDGKTFRKLKSSSCSNFSPDFVASYLRDLVVPVWIGLSDSLHEGKFAWSDGVSPVLYTNWADKEPNNADGQVRRSIWGLNSEFDNWILSIHELEFVIKFTKSHKILNLNKTYKTWRHETFQPILHNMSSVSFHFPAKN